MNEGSLLRLFQSEMFDAYFHMYYLFHRKEPGVHEYLVNLLYAKRTGDEITFYLPQLCQLSLCRYGTSSLYRFLLDKSAKSMHFALKASWLYQSIVEDRLPTLNEAAQKMTQETEMAVVNCKPQQLSHESMCDSPTPDLFYRKWICSQLPGSITICVVSEDEYIIHKREDTTSTSNLETKSPNSEKAFEGSSNKNNDGESNIILQVTYENDNDNDSDNDKNNEQNNSSCCATSEKIPVVCINPTTKKQTLPVKNNGVEPLNIIYFPVDRGPSLDPGVHPGVLSSVTAKSTSKKSNHNSPKLFESFLKNVGGISMGGAKVKLPSVYGKLGFPLNSSTLQLPTTTVKEIESELQQFMMKQRRCDYFNTLNHFISLIIEVSTLLSTEPDRGLRSALLRKFFVVVNEWMFARRCVVAACEGTFTMTGLTIPLSEVGPEPDSVNHSVQIIRIDPRECKVLSSKKRAPFLMVFEIADLDEDLAVLGERLRGAEYKESMKQNNWFNEAIETEDLSKVKDKLVSLATEMMSSKEYANSSTDSERKTTPWNIGHSAKSNTPTANGQPTTLRWRDLFIYNSILKELKSRELLPEGISTFSHGLVLQDTPVTILKKALRIKATEPQEGPCLIDFAPEVPNNDEGGASHVETKSDPQKLREELWGELWHEKYKRLKRLSPYGSLESWGIRSVLVKGGDDLRQELLASQLIRQFKAIFDQAKLPLWLRPYEVLVSGCNSGIMEFVHDTCSVDMLKKRYSADTIAQVFNAAFADNPFEAKKNFIESHAAYSLVSYFLQVRDRHNANLLLDAQGHLIHIDFGYMLSNSPGNFNFETSPFKLTQEFVDIMDGENSDNYEYFRTLIIRGFLEARKHADRIVLMVEMMLSAIKMPCFLGGPTYALEALRERFMEKLPEDVCIEKVSDLIDVSVNNFRTIQYDNFQRLTNGIL